MSLWDAAVQANRFAVTWALADTGTPLRMHEQGPLYGAYVCGDGNRVWFAAIEDKFPDATLRVRRADLEFPKEGSPVESQVTGELMLHGHARLVPVRYHAERRADGLTRIAGSLQLDMRDFEITPPSYLGVKVSPDVEVVIDLTVEYL